MNRAKRTLESDLDINLRLFELKPNPGDYSRLAERLPAFSLPGLLVILRNGTITMLSEEITETNLLRQFSYIRGAFTHMAGDAAVSVGVIIIGFAIKMTGWHWLDPAVSILIGVVIVWGTWSLLCESVNLAMDAVPEGIDLEKVEKSLAGLDGVTAVHDLHIWGMSTTENALTVHLVMPHPPENDEFLHHVSHEPEEDFAIGHVTIQIEHGDQECHQASPDTV